MERAPVQQTRVQVGVRHARRVRRDREKSEIHPTHGPETRPYALSRSSTARRPQYASPPWFAPVKRVCLLGAESTGKTTLAEELAHSFGTLVNPEYGRPYTEVGRDRDAPVDERGVHAHRAHPLLVRGLPRGLRAPRAVLRHRRVHDGGLPRGLPRHGPRPGFEDLVARDYDLFVVCGLDVPWRGDGIREFEVKRRWMHDRYVERARASGRPWLLVEGVHEARLEAARRGRRPPARGRRDRHRLTLTGHGTQHRRGGWRRRPACQHSPVAPGAVPAGREGRPSWLATVSTI